MAKLFIIKNKFIREGEKMKKTNMWESYTDEQLIELEVLAAKYKKNTEKKENE